jgi:hypothetical protein
MKTNFPLHCLRRSAALSPLVYEDADFQDSLCHLRSITGIMTSGKVGSAMERFQQAFHCTDSLTLLEVRIFSVHDPVLWRKGYLEVVSHNDEVASGSLS